MRQPSHTPPIEPSRRSTQRLWLAASVAVVATACVALTFLLTSNSPPPSSLEARRALARGDYVAAERLAVASAEATGSADLYLLAAEAAERRNNDEAAFDYYTLVAGDDPDDGYDNLLAAGDALMRGRRPSAAERKFRAAHQRRPQEATPRNRLAMLLLVTGRRREAIPFLFEAVRRRQHTVHTLCLLSQAEGANILPQRFAADDAAAQRDPLLLLALARRDMEEGDWTAARQRLDQALELEPSLVEAEVRKGQALYEAGDEQGFRRWAAELSDEAGEHPLSWHLRGLWAERNKPVPAAARAFWEALRRDPDFLPANYQLGRTLQELDRGDEAAAFLQRAADLRQLSTAAEILYGTPADLGRLQEASDATERLGRLWESWGWTLAAVRIDPGAEWAIERLRRLEPQLTSELSRTVASHRPADRIDLSSLPLPRPGGDRSESKQRSGQAIASIAFSDEAPRLGVDFTYWNGAPAGSVGKRMHEFTGGGVAAIDYDKDGAPDLFFTQGGPFPPGGQDGPFDRLFRNLGGAFVDVTAASGSLESARGFGQGVAAGDVDGDGFADLYVANVGRNRLLRNNGDGTFEDVSDVANLPQPSLTEAWTTSVVIADLTGDGLPDLFDVNYVTASDVFERLCTGSDGLPHGCAPTVFDGCPDRLLVNLGDGRFEDRSQAAGITAADGNGLGAVAADFDGSGKLSLFVANDQTANHFYASVRRPDSTALFEERALSLGLAYDRNGKAQACMGVAADDADGDGRLDLFVTNFYLEANTLYRQLPGGSFDDITVAFGLRDPSFKLLGFGTQFLDADLDGRPDLIVTNGHIDDFSSRDVPYRMRPQFFRNVGGRFEEIDAASLGPFFSTEALGRGLATLDWNQDGREDVVISHLDSPAALLTNRSAAGHGLGVRLVATTTARDAIGTVVTLTSDAGVRVRQLTAGDGYQASNERRLAFGIGAAVSGEVTVRWPSGRQETFGRLAAGADWLLVEGRGRPLKLRSHNPP